MKKFLTLAFVIAFLSPFAFAQVNPRGSATLDGGKVSIEYGRPSAKGRDVLSMVAPGSYWRMGADQATKLVTQVPLVFGDTKVPKGEYTLVGHFVTADEFHLVVAKTMGENEPEDVAAKVKGEISKGQEHVEQLTLSIEGGAANAAIVLSWAGNRIRMPFKVGS